VRPGTISVVIPVYNAALYIAESVASALQQTRPVLEVIVADDCSVDGSADVAAAAGARVVRMPVNAGPSAARNAAVRAAAGTYVAMLDADDQWEPMHCETVAGLLDAHPTADVANSRARLLPVDRETAKWTETDTPLDMLPRLLRANAVVQTTATIRRDTFLAAGGYDVRLRYAEDYDLWLRLARTSRFVFSHAVTAVYRVHDEQASQNTAPLAAGAWTVRQEHFTWIGRHRDRATTEAGAAHLRRALDDEIRWAWDRGDREAMQAIFAAGAWVPGAPAITQRWQRRLGATWPRWRLATAVRATVARRIRG
jgi:hypothetical protein